MTLGRCPLSIFCSRGTPPREVPRVCGPSTRGPRKFVELTNPEAINAEELTDFSQKMGEKGGAPGGVRIHVAIQQPLAAPRCSLLFRHVFQASTGVPVFRWTSLAAAPAPEGGGSYPCLAASPAPHQLRPGGRGAGGWPGHGRDGTDTHSEDEGSQQPPGPRHGNQLCGQEYRLRG